MGTNNAAAVDRERQHSQFPVHIHICVMAQSDTAGMSSKQVGLWEYNCFQMFSEIESGFILHWQNKLWTLELFCHDTPDPNIIKISNI